MRIAVLLSLLLIISACSNEKEVQNTIDAKKIETFTVTGMDCCPPAVVQSAIEQVDGVGRVTIESNGSTGKVTVSFDNTKTDENAIQKAVSDLGFGVQ
nr:mercury resistance system substrate-binding protein MerP [Bacillus pretiosus]